MAVRKLLLSVQFNGTAPAPSDARSSLSLFLDDEVAGCSAIADIVRIQRYNGSPELLEVVINTQSCYIGQIVLDYVAACSTAFSSINKVPSPAALGGIAPA